MRRRNRDELELGRHAVTEPDTRDQGRNSSSAHSSPGGVGALFHRMVASVRELPR